MRRDTVETCTRISSATLPIENFGSVTLEVATGLDPFGSFITRFRTSRQVVHPSCHFLLGKHIRTSALVMLILRPEGK
jgi:hypothetical protein